MATAENSPGLLTHSCEGLCQNGDRGMVSQHSAVRRNVLMKIENASKCLSGPCDVQLALPKENHNHIMLADQDMYPSPWLIGPIVVLLLSSLFVVVGGMLTSRSTFPKYLHCHFLVGSRSHDPPDILL